MRFGTGGSNAGGTGTPAEAQTPDISHSKDFTPPESARTKPPLSDTVESRQPAGVQTQEHDLSSACNPYGGFAPGSSAYILPAPPEIGRIRPQGGVQLRAHDPSAASQGSAERARALPPRPGLQEQLSWGRGLVEERGIFRRSEGFRVGTGGPGIRPPSAISYLPFERPPEPGRVIGGGPHGPATGLARPPLVPRRPNLPGAPPFRFRTPADAPNSEMGTSAGGENESDFDKLSEACGFDEI